MQAGTTGLQDYMFVIDIVYNKKSKSENKNQKVRRSTKIPSNSNQKQQTPQQKRKRGTAVRIKQPTGGAETARERGVRRKARAWRIRRPTPVQLC